MNIRTYQIRFVATACARLPRTKNNLLRSAFGAQAMKMLGPEGYAQLFEGRGEGRPPGMERIPPFTIQCADQRTKMEKGESFQFRLTLVNPDQFWLLVELVIRELTFNGVKFALVSVEVSELEFSEEGEVCELCLEFITPLLLKSKKRPLRNPGFPDLVRALVRRANVLGQAHGSGIPTWASEDLVCQAQGIQCQSDLHWVDWKRHSRSQDRRIKMGGLVGTMTLQGHLTPFLALLSFGTAIGVGSGLTMGNGAYKVR